MINKFLRAHRTVVATGMAIFTVAAFAAGVARADDFLDKAKADVARMSKPTTTWQGPSTGVKPPANKLVVFVSADEQNGASTKYGAGIKEAAALIGWKAVVIDGRGSPTGQEEGFNQAIALKADAIITTADATALKDQIKQADDRGITVIGIHGAATPGPHPELGLYTDIQTDGATMGRAQGEWIVANSDGKARVVVTTDCQYLIGCSRARGVEEVIKQCTGCKLLEFNSSPAGESQQRMPVLTTSWVQKYGMPLYITSVSDAFADFQVTALRAGEIDPTQVILVSMDGTPAAFQRVRAGNQYQQVTIPEPITMQAYEAVDDVIRALNKLPPSVSNHTPYIVTKANVTAAGGDDNGYEPANGYRKHYAALWGIGS